MTAEQFKPQGTIYCGNDSIFFQFKIALKDIEKHRVVVDA